MAAIATEPSNAYQGAAAAWVDGPAALYDRLASIAIAGVAHELRGATVLDVGAGTGALCRALRTAGAIPVAIDTSPDMLDRIGEAVAASVVGDMCALPLTDGRLDAAVSGFAISHIDDPQDALTEMCRVVRPRGPVIATVFGEAPASAAKDVVDTVARDFGFIAPDWYLRLKTRTEPRSNTPALLHACAASAGLEDVDVADLTLESGLETPESIAAYRTGLAHIAPFVASLPAPRRTEFIERAIEAIRATGQPLRPRILVLSSRVPA